MWYQVINSNVAFHISCSRSRSKLFQPPCDSKYFSVKGASALIPFRAKCLHGRPIVNRNFKIALIGGCMVFVDEGERIRYNFVYNLGVYGRCCECWSFHEIISVHLVQLHHLVLDRQVETLKHCEKIINRRSQKALQVRMY